LQRHGLSREAAEDPDILLHRIERIAEQVHRSLQRPPEHPPVTVPEDAAIPGVADPETTEALWTDLFRANRRRQEQFLRALEERTAQGEDDETAFENALEDVGLGTSTEETDLADEAWQEEQEPLDEFPSGEIAGSFKTREDRHPLLERTMNLLAHLHTVFRD